MTRALLVAAAVALLAPAGTASAQRIFTRRTTLTLRGTPENLVFSIEIGRARRLDATRDTVAEHGIHREQGSTFRQTAVSEVWCTAPCTTEVDVGVYYLRLGVRGQGDASAGELLLRPGPHTIVGHYASRADARMVGGILLVPGLLGVIVSLFSLIASPWGWVAVAASAAVCGVSLGLVALGDDAGIVADPPAR